MKIQAGALGSRTGLPSEGQNDLEGEDQRMNWSPVLLVVGGFGLCEEGYDPVLVQISWLLLSGSLTTSLPTKREEAGPQGRDPGFPTLHCWCAALCFG